MSTSKKIEIQLSLDSINYLAEQLQNIIGHYHVIIAKKETPHIQLFRKKRTEAINVATELLSSVNIDTVAIRQLQMIILGKWSPQKK